ncbi:hypothetical protein F5884DRAFT_741972 [Xylogone sp. PMI_703]|nr:hypothetical protein F5884DRAFT_741972 [Xylogone sp. PMI_703]
MPSYVIVGASQGLGYDWLRFLSADSSNTMIGLVRTPSNVQPRLEKDNLSSKVHILQADLADYSSLERAASEVSKLTPDGAVDYLIVNGVHVNLTEYFCTPLQLIGKEDLLTTEMLESVKVNVLGPLYSVHAFLPLIRKSKIKKIAVMTSGFADLDWAQKSRVAFTVCYSTTKAAVNMAVARYSVELRKESIIILALSPGFVNTMGDKPSFELPDEMKQKFGLVLEDFKELKPDFPGHPVTTEESIRDMKKTLEEVTIEKSGMFLSHHGDQNWL